LSGHDRAGAVVVVVVVVVVGGAVVVVVVVVASVVVGVVVVGAGVVVETTVEVGESVVLGAVDSVWVTSVVVNSSASSATDSSLPPHAERDHANVAVSKIRAECTDIEWFNRECRLMFISPP
jgi:hypothetical protein